ncbi:efflux RND transporter periplasmic adaptor subunit [Aureibacillus halotolerans]|uniref:efflux RND transporter periplasmic adaptor subunit n=1 Tax=Aureibacillus halotolerans TaxID=1508390 RepID=UPI0014150B25|nr:efflux RND transporter periplasmic adaptor subunit [Aureibacillus halotolerans]
MLVSGCSSQAADGALTRDAKVVEVAPVEAGTLTSSYSLSGTLEAEEVAPVSFELNGKVESIAVNVGDAVQQGAAMATLDNDAYALQVQKASTGIGQAQAAVAQSKASVEAAQGGLSSARGQQDAAQAQLQEVEDGAREQELTQAENAVKLAEQAVQKAEADAERLSNLFEQGLATEDNKEKAQLALEQARNDYAAAQSQLSILQDGATQAQVDAAKAQVTQTDGSVASAQAQISQAQAGLQQAQAALNETQVSKAEAELQLSKTTLTSPLSGVVLTKTVSVGEPAAPGQPSFTVGVIDQLKVMLPVSSDQVSQWEKGQTVSIALGDQTREGTVQTISPTASGTAGKVEVEVVVPNASHDWMPGQVVTAENTENSQEGLLVPVEAVINTGGDPYVFLIQDGKAVRTTVVIEGLYQNRYHITQGLEKGDQIVIQGASQLLNGDLIEPADVAGDDTND